MDVPRGRLALYPAETVFRPGKFRLPILMPRFYGSVSYRRAGARETYLLENLEGPRHFRELGLRTAGQGDPRVTVQPSWSGSFRQEGDRVWLSNVALRPGRTLVEIEH
jgi:hypothetical protein